MRRISHGDFPAVHKGVFYAPRVKPQKEASMDSNFKLLVSSSVPYRHQTTVPCYIFLPCYIFYPYYLIEYLELISPVKLKPYYVPDTRGRVMAASSISFNTWN